METKPQPKIYVADVVVDAKIPQSRAKVKKYDLRSLLRLKIDDKPRRSYRGS